ncbi:MAG: hypothetical protein MJZ15_11865 [Bacteroidales bacterium]|nr:hypothetical protein [Bacteroidales bacterium]
MTREQLQGSYGEREAQAAYNEIKAKNDFIGFAIDYMHDEDYQVARNALWVLTKATDDELLQLQPILDKLIDLTMHTDNSSVRRLSMNIIVRLKMEKEEIRTDLLDFCLEHATNMTEYPGIQSLAIKIAYKICSFYPELMGELMRILDGMEIEYYKPAVKSIRNRILAGKYRE